MVAKIKECPTQSKSSSKKAFRLLLSILIVTYCHLFYEKLEFLKVKINVQTIINEIGKSSKSDQTKEMGQFM